MSVRGSGQDMSPTSTIAADGVASNTTGAPKYPPTTSKPSSSYTLRSLPWQVYTTPFDSILSEDYSGSGTDSDPYIVDWIPDDAEDPQRWPMWYRWWTIFIVSFTTLAVALSSSAYSGGIESLVREFQVSTELLTAGISLFVVGFAFGPLLWAPLSEVYGRRIIFIISYFFLTIWTIGCALSQTIPQLLVFRFLCGFFGSSPLANAGGVISDVLAAKNLGIGMAFFAAGPFLGPALGPITGGFLGLTAGWRWIEWFLAIFCGIIFAVLTLACPETYAPTLLRTRAAKLSKATGKVYRFRADAKGKLELGPLFGAALTRPWKFLLFEPIVIILTIYTAVIYGVLYLNFAAYPIVFQQLRGWNSGEGGLAFLGILVGTVLAVIISIVYVQPKYIRDVKKRGYPTPEDRLPPAIWGGFLIVIGLAGFAATNGPDIHWIAPIIFGVPFGLGIVVTFLATLAYLVDSYTIYAASVLAANSVLRSLFGAAFPLFTSYMYRDLGIHWAAALPGFIALACIPFTWVFYKYGAQIRAKCKYAADAERQMKAIMAMRKQQAEAQARKKAAAAGDSTAVGDVDVEASGTSTRRPSEGTVLGTQDKEAEKSSGQAHHSSEAHEWTTYEALADRDEVDLADDERRKLYELHEKFNYAKHKDNEKRSQA